MMEDRLERDERIRLEALKLATQAWSKHNGLVDYDEDVINLAKIYVDFIYGN